MTSTGWSGAACLRCTWALKQLVVFLTFANVDKPVLASKPLSNQPMQKSVYVFGHSENELQRLIEQSRFFGGLTEQVFLGAGLASGMRVLDVGCGAGDVSFLAAKHVGASGRVLGMDKSSASVAVARERAEAAKLQNVTFIEGDVTDLSLEHSFDAVVGRLVLMYLPDPVAALRRIATHVRTDGLIVFHEMDATGFRSLPYSPLFEKCAGWINETCRRGGIETQMGLKLHQAFVSAGLPAPQMILGARIEGGPNSPAYEYVVQTVRSLLPMMEQLGVAKAEEVQIETLAQRMRDEVTSGGGVIVIPPLVGAWARKPL
jgi:ubiquinone/menaquinone biosynthesis C-methylase UbiE